MPTIFDKFTIYFIKTKIISSLVPLYILICSATYLDQRNVTKEHTIYIQPLGIVDSYCLNYLKKSVEDFYGYKCSIRTKIESTNNILSISNTRYDAKKILHKYNSNINLLLITVICIEINKNIVFYWKIIA